MRHLKSILLAAALMGAASLVTTTTSRANPAPQISPLVTPLGSLFRWETVVDAGPGFVKLSGDLRALFAFSEYCECMSYDGWPESKGYHAAVRGMKIISSAVAIGAAAEYVRIDATYRMTGPAGPIYDTVTNHIKLFQRTYETRVIIDEVTLAPFVRVYLLPLPVFVEGGLSTGVIVGQQGSSQYTAGSQDASLRDTVVDKSVTHLGTPLVQLAAIFGAGGTVDLGAGFGLEIAIRTRLGLNPFFQESTAKLDYSIEPAIGLSLAL